MKNILPSRYLIRNFILYAQSEQLTTVVWQIIGRNAGEETTEPQGGHGQNVNSCYHEKYYGQFSRAFSERQHDHVVKKKENDDQQQNNINH